MAIMPISLIAQSLYAAADFPDTTIVVPSLRVAPTYTQPSQATMFKYYFSETFGPYTLAGSAAAAGLDQFTNSPPEWNQGVKGYARRFGSDFGISTVTTSTRYGMAELLKEDTLYYRCQCTGFFPRTSHAILSTLTGRRGQDGHRVFSFPALVAPYAGPFAGIYGWYPDRYGAKDAFRSGNYSLLVYMGGNIGLEFWHTGPHSWLTRLHMNNAHAAPDPGTTQ